MLQVLFGKKCGLEGVDLDEVAVKTEGFVAQDFVDFTNRTVFESFKEGEELMMKYRKTVISNKAKGHKEKDPPLLLLSYFFIRK